MENNASGAYNQRWIDNFLRLQVVLSCFIKRKQIERGDQSPHVLRGRLHKLMIKTHLLEHLITEI